jgi:hypothetical protein
MRRLLGCCLVAAWASLLAQPAAAESAGHGKSDHGGGKKSDHGSARKDTHGGEKPAGAASRDARGDRLPATEFVTLNAFTVPLLIDGKMTEQFTIVIALELAEEDKRDAVVQMTPRLRNEIYDFLFKSVTFRTGEPRIPRTADLRAQLFRVVRKFATPEHVKSIVVQQAVRANMP